MGSIADCCSKQSIIKGTSISVFSLNEDDALKNNDIYKDTIPIISDINQAQKFITSEEYYPLLIKNIPKHIISKKICQKLNNNDIIKLINNLINWIQTENNDNCNDNIKHNINLIKENTKIGLNSIMKEIKDIKFDDKLDAYILQALTSTSLIVQCILFLIKQSSNEFKVNIWENGNIVNEAKKYLFQTTYFLLLTKKKYNGQNKNNINNENKITNDKKEEINNFFKISIDFANDLINS